MNLRRQVSKMLVARGFRRDGRAHLQRIDDEFSFAVDTGLLNDKPDIAPFIGIRHESVERRLAQLMELPEEPWIATVGANVGYVLGQGYRWWAPPSTADEVLAAIDAGLERLRPFLSLEKLPGVWDLAGVKDPAWRYRDIVILLLRGERDAIPARLDAAREEFCKVQDEVCEQFEQFARNVRAA
jgi:hypothetical protein